jgi:hypothetical protein
MNTVMSDSVSLTSRTTTWPPALRQRLVPPVIAYTFSRLVEAKAPAPQRGHLGVLRGVGG